MKVVERNQSFKDSYCLTLIDHQCMITIHNYSFILKEEIKDEFDTYSY